MKNFKESLEWILLLVIIYLVVTMEKRFQSLEAQVRQMQKKEVQNGR